MHGFLGLLIGVELMVDKIRWWKVGYDFVNIYRLLLNRRVSVPFFYDSNPSIILVCTIVLSDLDEFE